MRGIAEVLRRKFPRFFPKPKQSPADPWEGSEGFRTGLYREEIEELARWFSPREGVVCTSFDAENKCAEIRIYPRDMLLVRIRMLGNPDLGNDYTVVMCGQAMTEEMRTDFRNCLPAVQFRPLQEEMAS